MNETEEIHKLGEKLSQADMLEREIDRCFCGDYHIKRVTRASQKKGVDRILVCKKTGLRYTVEYKTDQRTADTGNIFVETISVDEPLRLGWAYTSYAQLLAYHVPQWGKVSLTPMTMVKWHVEEWKQRYKMSPLIPNEGVYGDKYNSRGILVPWEQFEKDCHSRIYRLDDETEEVE